MDQIKDRFQRFKSIGQRYKFIANAGAYVSSSFLVKSAGFLLTPLWAYFLSPEDYGIIGTLAAYSGVITTVFMMGLTGAVVRHYYDHLDDEEDLKSYISSILLFQMFVSGLIILALSIWGPSLWAKLTTGKIPFDPYVRIMLWTACISNWVSLPQALFQAQQNARTFVMIGYGRFALGVIANLVLIVWFKQGAYGQMLGQLLAGAFVALILLVMMWRRWFSTRIRWEHIRTGLIFGLPLVPHLLAAWVMQAADRLILERYISLEEMGLYNFGYTLGMVMSFIVTGINQAWSPYYYRLMDNNTEPEPRIIQVVSIYIALIGGICLAGILFAGEIVHLILPGSYYGAVPYIAPVLLGYLLLGLYYFSSMPIFYYKQTKLLPLITGSAALINILLNLWLVPEYGALGSAWITMTTYSIFFIIAYMIGRKYQQIEYPVRSYLIIILCIFGFTLLNLRLGVMDFSSVLIKIGLMGIFTALVYFLLIRTITKQDIINEILS